MRFQDSSDKDDDTGKEQEQSKYDEYDEEMEFLPTDHVLSPSHYGGSPSLVFTVL